MWRKPSDVPPATAEGIPIVAMFADGNYCLGYWASVTGVVTKDGRPWYTENGYDDFFLFVGPHLPKVVISGVVAWMELPALPEWAKGVGE